MIYKSKLLNSRDKYSRRGYKYDCKQSNQIPYSIEKVNSSYSSHIFPDNINRITSKIHNECSFVSVFVINWHSIFSKSISNFFSLLFATISHFLFKIYPENLHFFERCFSILIETIWHAFVWIKYNESMPRWSNWTLNKLLNLTFIFSYLVVIKFFWSIFLSNANSSAKGFLYPK